jgi:hypothetical protein
MKKFGAGDERPSHNVKNPIKKGFYAFYISLGMIKGVVKHYILRND